MNKVKKQIEAGFRGMRAGQLLAAVSNQLDQTAGSFLKKYLAALIVNAAKSGKVKTAALKDAVKDFGKKNTEDKTGIEWDKLELDPSTMTFKCLFDGDSKKKLDAFMAEYEKAADGAAVDAEKDQKKLEADAKKAGLKLSDNELKDEGIIASNVLSKGKGKDGAELKKDFEAAVSLKKKLADDIEKQKATRAKLSAADTSSVSEKDLKKAMKQTQADSDKEAKQAESKQKNESIHQLAVETILLEASKADLGKAALAAIVKYKKEAGLPDVMSQLNPADSMAIRKLPEVAKWLKSGGTAARNQRTNALSSIIMKSGKIVNDPDDKFAKIHRATLGLPMNKVVDLDAATTAADTADDAASKIEDVVKSGAISTTEDGRVFNYMTMLKRLDKIDNMFLDGVIADNEFKAFTDFSNDMSQYEIWAAEHSGSSDPSVLQKVALIQKLSWKFNRFEMDHFDDIQEMTEDNSVISMPVKAKKLAAKAAGSEEMKQAGSSFLGKAFTALGVARLAAKTAGVVLNKGKDVVDCIGAFAMKQKEDKGVIAEVKFILSNAKGAETKFDDTKFSVRYDVDDGKWHATCLDNRKLKFPEEEVVKKVLSSDEGKKFKEFCLKRWKSIFKPDDKKAAVVPFVLKNFEKLGLKADRKTKEFSKTIQKVDSQFTKIEKDFSSSANESLIEADRGNEKLDVDISKELESNEELKKDSKLKKAAMAVWSVLEKPLKTFAVNKAGDLIDEILLGQFKDSLLKVYKDEKLDKMSDEEASKELEELQKDANFKKGVENAQLDSRKDDNESTAIDKKSIKFQAIWYAEKDDENVAKAINDLVVDMQKEAKKLEDDQKELASKLKSMKIDNLKDEDIVNFGPVLKSMVDNGKKADDIAKKLKELKGDVKESIQSYLSCRRICSSALLKESTQLTEKQKQEVFISALLESKVFQDAMCQQLISEGFFGDAFKKLSNKIPDKFKQKVKDFSAKTLKTLGSGTFQGLLSLGGIAMSVATGGWGAALLLRCTYALERHGKSLRNSFERQWTKFANSGGVFTRMDFKIEGQEKSAYSMRFYSKDMVWRVLNVADQLKHPGKDWAKAIVEGEEGKKYRERLKAIWDPVFSKAKGGKIDFVALFEQAKDLKIPEKQLKLWKDFAENYDKIVSACCDSPKIDTRTQSLKKDKLDK